jgi:SAM-dependent methyltransferase
LSGYDLTHVPGKAHYAAQYVRGGRVFSYAHQIDTVLSFEPTSVVEIGAGGGMVAAALRSVGIDVTIVDVQPELNPDVLASVTDLPFEARRFDVAMCCQVLEHLPFATFEVALRELHRVTKTALVLSLPDITSYVSVSIETRRFGLRSTAVSLPLRAPSAESLKFRAGHYWEIGCRGSVPQDVETGIVRAGWRIKRTWRVPEMTWHRFYECVA